MQCPNRRGTASSAGSPGHHPLVVILPPLVVIWSFHLLSIAIVQPCIAHQRRRRLPSLVSRYRNPIPSLWDRSLDRTVIQYPYSTDLLRARKPLSATGVDCDQFRIKNRSSYCTFVRYCTNTVSAKSRHTRLFNNSGRGPKRFRRLSDLLHRYFYGQPTVAVLSARHATNMGSEQRAGPYS